MSKPHGAGPSSVDEPGAALDPGLREHLLQAYDLAMLANATNYDLRQRPERRRSARDLAALFHRAVRAAGCDLFVEAGAKEADASRHARRYLDDSARVVAFEGNPYVHERFRADNTEGDHPIEYRHLALSDAPGEVTFHLRRGRDGRPLADGRASLRTLQDEDHQHGYAEVVVEATTLDDFFEVSEVDSCALWVDVEGAAEEVLTGGHQLLSKTDALLIEVEELEEWKWGPAWTVTDVCDHLFDYGLIPVARDYQARYQYNILFVSSRLLHDHYFRGRLAVFRSAAYRTRGRQTPDAEQATAKKAAAKKTAVKKSAATKAAGDAGRRPRLRRRVRRRLGRVARRLHLRR